MRIKTLFRFITLIILIVHFTLTVLYVMPSNPVRRALLPLPSTTIGTYFPQDWKLFAPNPTSTDFILLVRPLSTEEYNVAQIAGTAGWPSDGWYDTLSPLWAKSHSNPFSANMKIARIAFKAILSYRQHSDEESVQVLIKFASAFCKDIGQNQANYMALMIESREAIPWSQRNAPKPRVIKTMPIGLFPIEKNVENDHLYQLPIAPLPYVPQ